MDGPSEARQVEMEAVGARLGKKTIELDQIGKGYDGREMFRDFTYIFKRFERIGFVGPNGCGKSTLMRILAGIEEPDSGVIQWGETIKIGYFAQECAVMDEKERVIDYIKDQAEYIRISNGRISASRMLERFLFSPDMQYAPIAKISGGERRRLYLLRVLMSEPNVLILDEPTNDLDIATLQVLEEFLDSFMGIVIVVSHDRYFLDRIADRIAAFEGERIRIYEGDYTDYLEKSRSDVTQEQSKEAGRKKTAEDREKKKKSYRDPEREKIRFSYNEQKEYETIEEDMEKLEEELESIEEELIKNATNFVKLNEWIRKKEEAQAMLEKKMERWVYLQDLAEKIEEQKMLSR